MTKVYNIEFKEALREITQRVAYFNSPHGNLKKLSIFIIIIYIYIKIDNYIIP